MSAKIILFPQPGKKGYPIKIRIIQNRKAHYINLRYYIPANQKDKYWNIKKNELRKSYEHYEAIQTEFKRQLQILGLDDVEQDLPLFSSTNQSFLTYFQTFLDTLEAKKQYGMKQNCKTTYNHLEKFSKEIGRSELMFKDLNIDFLNAFQSYLLRNDVSAITQRGYFEKIRRLLNKAISEDRFNPRRHPFTGFEFAKSQSKPKCLEIDEFEYLKKFSPKSSVSKRVHSMFLFQYYAFGMRVSDLMLLKLKVLSDELNNNPQFQFHLTSHMARHTFAYLSMLNGNSVYMISKALNHKSIKTTEAYLSGFKNRVLDNKLYNKEMLRGEKDDIDKRLHDYIKNANYEKKLKLLELMEMVL